MEKKSLTLVPLPNPHGLSGACLFADIGRWEATIQSADCTAPEWRRAEPGLCLEGDCKNVSCLAHVSMVIMNKGFTDFFDLSRQYDDCHCPLCYKRVAPVKHGFSNCFWRIKGANFQTKAQLNTNWTKSENEYFTFDVDACGPTSHLILRIFMRPFNDAPTNDLPVPVPQSFVLRAFARMTCTNYHARKIFTRTVARSGIVSSLACVALPAMDITLLLSMRKDILQRRESRQPEKTLYPSTLVSNNFHDRRALGK